MIPASLPALAIHPLLNHDPLAVVGHDEAVQIKIKAVLHRGAVDLGYQPARLCQRDAIKPNPLTDCDQLVRCLT